MAAAPGDGDRAGRRGGGTDQTARMLVERLQEEFGQPFNIVNQGQGGGVVGINSIKTAETDGYILGVIYNFAHCKPMGQADFDAEDFTPIAQYNLAPACFHVRADSEWDSLPEALDAIEADPGAYSIACGGGCEGSCRLPADPRLDRGLRVPRRHAGLPRRCPDLPLRARVVVSRDASVSPSPDPARFNAA